MLWDLQVLMFNLFICMQEHRSQVTGLYGVEPQTVVEYHHSANPNLYIEWSGIQVEDYFDDDMGNADQAYYH